MFFVLFVGNLPTRQRPFTPSLGQSLGQISYCLFTVNGPIFYAVGRLILCTANSEVNIAKESMDGTPYKMTGEVMAVTNQEYIQRCTAGAMSNLVKVIWVGDWL